MLSPISKTLKYTIIAVIIMLLMLLAFVLYYDSHSPFDVHLE